ncbi:MAG: TetR/AcrR family transcriptional regulator [Parasphingorhabdus sp.]
MKIMDVTEQAIRKKGCNGFSIDEIARDVGIKKSSLYHHFSSKSELVAEIFKHFSNRVFTFLDQTTANVGTAGGRLLAYVAETRELLDEGDSICLSIALNIDQQSLHTQLIRDLDIFHRTNIEWLAATFELGLVDGTIADIGDLTEEANACLALVDGAQLMARTHRNAKYYDDATALLRARVCEIDTNIDH